MKQNDMTILSGADVLGRGEWAEAIGAFLCLAVVVFLLMFLL